MTSGSAPDVTQKIYQEEDAMSYVPDCRTDEAYNERYLKEDDAEFVRGYDWCAERAVENAFDNLDAWEPDLDVRPSDIKKVVEAFKPFLLDWIETGRNELITSMIDNMSAEEYQSIAMRRGAPRRTSDECSGLSHRTPPPAQNTAKRTNADADMKHESAIHGVPTCELVTELRTREGVETTVVEAYVETSIRASGPAIVLNVTD